MVLDGADRESWYWAEPDEEALAAFVTSHGRLRAHPQPFAASPQGATKLTLCFLLPLREKDA